MMADAGFDGQSVRDDDLVPPVRRGGNLLHPDEKCAVCGGELIEKEVEKLLKCGVHIAVIEVT